MVSSGILINIAGWALTIINTFPSSVVGLRVSPGFVILTLFLYRPDAIKMVLLG